MAEIVVDSELVDIVASTASDIAWATNQPYSVTRDDVALVLKALKVVNIATERMGPRNGG